MEKFIFCSPSNPYGYAFMLQVMKRDPFIRPLQWSDKPLQRHINLSMILSNRIGERNLHVSVHKILSLGYEPADWHLLALEQPSDSEQGVTRIAYTQSDKKREAEIRTVISPGKYLKRHFPTAPDHVIRDAVALAVEDTFHILSDSDEMVDAVVNGPASCMSDDFHEDDHPYRSYDPGYGWRLAVRKAGGEIKGRALINVEDAKESFKGVFVRSYCKVEGCSHSPTDEALNAWLIEQGFKKKYSWPEGLRLAKVGNLPYIDGVEQRLTAHRDYYVIDSDGELLCTNTDGTADQQESCDDCGGNFDEDDLNYACDRHVCEGCLDANYRYVYDGSYRTYISKDEDIYEYNEDFYTEDGLKYHGLVVTVDGNVERKADCVEILDDWYLESDERVVEDINGDWQLKSDCVFCAQNESYVLESVATLIGDKWIYNEDIEQAVADETVSIDDVPEEIKANFVTKTEV